MDAQSQRSSTASGKSRLNPEAEKCTVSGYEDYLSFLDGMDRSKPLFIFYTGTKSPTSGYSWCPICIESGHFLEKYLADRPEIVFLSVNVGTQDEWDDRSNPFRTDEDIKLKVVPTILKYKSTKRLEGPYCLRKELLDLLFEDNNWEF